MYRVGTTEERSVLVVAFNARVYGLDPSDGEIQWEHELDRSNPANVVKLAFCHDRVFAQADKVLMGIRYPTGEALWRKKLLHSGGQLIVERDKLFVSGQGVVYGFDLDGNALWHNGFKRKGHGSVSLGFPDNLCQADER